MGLRALLSHRDEHLPHADHGPGLRGKHNWVASPQLDGGRRSAAWTSGDCEITS
jgi:hypothetical protein